MWHGLTVKQLGLLPNGKQINLKKKSLLVHKEVKIKTRKNAIVEYLDYHIPVTQREMEICKQQSEIKMRHLQITPITVAK